MSIYGSHKACYVSHFYWILAKGSGKGDLVYTSIPALSLHLPGKAVLEQLPLSSSAFLPHFWHNIYFLYFVQLQEVEQREVILALVDTKLITYSQNVRQVQKSHIPSHN